MIAVRTDAPGFVTSIGFACGEYRSKDGLEISVNALALSRWFTLI